MSASRSRSDEVRHVIIVTNALAPDKLGGLERYVRELAAGLVRQGLQVTVLTKRVHPEHPAREVGPDGVAVVRHNVPSKRLRTFALRYPVHVAASIWKEVGHLEPEALDGVLDRRHHVAFPRNGKPRPREVLQHRRHCLDELEDPRTGSEAPRGEQERSGLARPVVAVRWPR